MNKNNKNKIYPLARSIAQLVPFHGIPINREQQQQKEIITTKLLIMVIIAIVKIPVLILWI